MIPNLTGIFCVEMFEKLHRQNARLDPFVRWLVGSLVRWLCGKREGSIVCTVPSSTVRMQNAKRKQAK